MPMEAGLVFGILAATLVLLASDRLRLDLVALLSLLALSLTGILTPAEALAGFADPVVLMIAGLFVVADGLFQTGVARAMGRIPGRIAGESEVGLVAVIMLMVAVLSGFLSSTGTVAVMLPVVVGLARDRDVSASKLLIPVSVASLLGGTLTLIGTPPNLVVSGQLEAMDREPFGFFTFTPVGLAVLAVGIGFMLAVGRRLLPDRSAPHAAPRGGTGREATTSVDELSREYDLASTLFDLRVDPGSRMAGRTLGESALRSRYGVTVVDIRRPDADPDAGSRLEELANRAGLRDVEGEPPGEGLPVVPRTRFQPGDVLKVQGSPGAVADVVVREGLTLLSREEEQGDGDGGVELPREVGLVEVLLTPRSRLIGQTLGDAAFRERFRVTVLAVHRLGEPLEGDLRDARLRFGDSLLVKGPWPNIRLLEREQRDFVVAGEPAEMEAALRPVGRAPLAVGIMLGMMVLMTADLVAPVHAVLLAAVGMVLSGCVRTEEAYRSINWEAVVLIAGILPMATALEKSGGMDLIVQGMTGLLAAAGPVAMLAGVMVLTSGLSQLISNTATTALLAPIAFQLAVDMGVAPEPFMMGMAVAASTAFATPMASPVNTLVLGPGGYRFGDFFKVGVTLQLLVVGVALLVVPVLFPF